MSTRRQSAAKISPVAAVALSLVGCTMTLWSLYPLGYLRLEGAFVAAIGTGCCVFAARRSTGGARVLGWIAITVCAAVIGLFCIAGLQHLFAH